jgi:predicted metal-binding membrane protein
VTRFACCPPAGGSFGSARFYLVTGFGIALSLGLTLYFCLSMSGGMDMPGGWRMSMMWMRMPDQGWLESAGMFLAMWLSMMVAMMLPSVMFKLLLFYRSLVWKRADHPGFSTALVGAGYFLVWTALGVGVYALGISWALAAMHFSSLSRAVPFLTGAALILAGLYQFSRWKTQGLASCRKPIVYGYIPKRGRKPKPKKDQPEIIEDAGLWNSLSQGLRQGTNCAVCCAGSMLTLVALGAMNLFVMLAVAVVIALEKLLPQPQVMVKLSGFLALGLGFTLVVRAFLKV